MRRAAWWVAMLALMLGAGCKSLKPGECRKDNDCSGQVKGGLPACYKEPPEAELGRCMTVKEAREARDRFEARKSGLCEDRDGDGAKAGPACDPKLDGVLDCDDGDPAVKAGATEVCDGKDNNCDGRMNEGLPQCVSTVLGGKQNPVMHFMTNMTNGVRVTAGGEVWVTDEHQIYRVGTDGKPVRVAGSEKPGNDDKQGKFARFDKPRGIAVGPDGSVFITDCNNNCIRRLSAEGQASAYAGKCSSEADDTGLDKDGGWQDVRFYSPVDLTFDKDGNLLVVDMLNSKIKLIDKNTREVKTIAGRGGKDTTEGVVFGMSNGPAKQAEFNEPAGIAVGPGGEVYIADQKNNCIRLLKGGQVSTFAGVCAPGKDKGGHKDGPAAAARFLLPNAVDVAPDGSVVVADTGNHVIRRVAGGQVTTVAGKPGQQGYFDGAIGDALFNEPQSVSVGKDGSIYVVDHGNYRVRRIAP